MRNVTVTRQELLTKVELNRDAHRDFFLRAQEGYRAAVIAELDAMLSEARDGKKIRRAIMLPEPVDHTSDYNRVIEMLRMSVDEHVELDSQSFDQYVLDNWQWSALALMANSTYAKP